MDRSGRDKAANSLNMVHSVLNSIVCPPSLCICPFHVGNPCSRIAIGNPCWILGYLDFGIGFHFSHSQLYSLNPSQEPTVYSLLPIQKPNSSELPLCRLTMVRHRVRSCHGGSCGGRACSQAAQPIDQPSPPTSPPSSQANSPNPSPSIRPFPHIAFQSTHFKFQSSLNRPIITANITIIFFEEEAQPHAPTRTLVEHPQGIRRIAGSHGPE